MLISYPSNFVWSGCLSIFNSTQDISTKIPVGLGLSSVVRFPHTANR